MNDVLTNLAKQQLGLLHELLEHLRVPSTSPGRPMCALVLTMAELFEAVTRLTAGGLVTHAAVHVRSMLEALTDFRLLAKSQAHVDVMLFKQLQGELRTYQRALESPLPPADRQEMEGLLANCKERYKTVFESLSKEQRSAKTADAFALAELPELITPYTILSSMAHNDLAALAIRHQGENTMQLRGTTPVQIVVLVHTMAHYALMVAVKELPMYMRFNDNAFDARHAKMIELHNRVLDTCGTPN